MLLVHGEAAKMQFLKGKIEQEFSKCTTLFTIYHLGTATCVLTDGKENVQPYNASVFEM